MKYRSPVSRAVSKRLFRNTVRMTQKKNLVTNSRGGIRL